MGEGLFDKSPEGSHRTVARWLQQGRDGGERFSRRWRIKNVVDPVRVDPSIAPVIYFDDRGHGTPEEAVGLFEGDAMIRRRLAGSQPKAVLEGVEQCKTTLDTAAYACAHPNDAGSWPDKTELRVVAGNTVHLALGNPKV